MALVRGRGPGVSTDMVALAAELLRRPCEDHDQDRVDPHITWAARLKTLAADHDRIVAEAEARGWNAAVEAVPHSEICLSLDPDADERDCDCYHRIVVAALRRPEVEG